LEVPVSVIETQFSHFDELMESAPRLLRRISRRIMPPVLQMVPRDSERNCRYMRAILRHAIDHRRPCVLLATHSSELMPGGSPFFPSAKSIERLYYRLEILFSSAAEAFCGMTLSEFREGVSAHPGLL
jgi:hypothetical protein